MNSEAICDEIEWLIQRNPFADNLPADITINDLLDKLEAFVTTPQARASLKDVRGVLDGAYKGEGWAAGGDPLVAAQEARTRVREQLGVLRDLIAKGA